MLNIRGLIKGTVGRLVDRTLSLMSEEINIQVPTKLGLEKNFEWSLHVFI